MELLEHTLPKMIATRLELSPDLPRVDADPVQLSQGIHPDDLPRIFDPFFTTKEVGKGAGLGLSMVHGIVQSHGGHIECHGSLGQGSTFTIYLAAHEQEKTGQAGEAAQPAEPPGGYETILLADDEEPLRITCQRILTSAGYQVLAAKSGEEALEIYRRHGPGIHLLVMDLGMPGMGGAKARQAELLTTIRGVLDGVKTGPT